jgi:hypothetical protein
MLDKIKNWFGKDAKVNPAPTAPRPEAPPPPPKSKTTKTVEKTEKEIATDKGEPWVSIVKLDIDPKNLHQGSFELDWNDKFIADLVRAGYMIKKDDTDAEIIDRWFQTICRHVVMETYEQTEAMSGATPGRWTQVKDIGDGRSERS